MKKLIDGDFKLGFGLMRLPRLEDGKTFDIGQCREMVDHFIAAGGNYFDTAFIYEGSEEATKQALVDRYPRDRYYLATKLNPHIMCANEEQARQQIHISLERTGAGYFDFYLLHGIDRNNYSLFDKYNCWEYVKELKEKGLIRHYGFSFHDTPEFLEQILREHPDMEFVQLQINYADWEDSSIQARRCYEVAVKYDVPVIVMEPVKGGTLAVPPEPVEKILKAADPDASASSWAVRFAASLDQVMVVLSGMSTTAQVDDNVSFMKDFKKLDEAEQKVIENARETLMNIHRIACTGCRYCTPGCPMEIQIPDIFSVMNHYLMYDKLEQAREDYGWRAGSVPASACVECGQCEGACPQHLPIIRYLKDTAAALENV